jgi:hypothetical protein
MYYKYLTLQDVQAALDYLNTYWNLDTSPTSNSYYGMQAVVELYGAYYIYCDEYTNTLTAPLVNLENESNLN